MLASCVFKWPASLKLLISVSHRCVIHVVED